MTKFQKQFLSKCLDYIDTTISNDDKLQGAVLSFKQVKLGERPHEIPTKITDSENWSVDEKTGLSAAILLATALTSTELFQEGFENSIEEATNLLLDTYVPLITKGTESGNRLASVRTNIAKVKSEIDPPIEINSYSFFSAVGVVALVAAAAISLTR